MTLDPTHEALRAKLVDYAIDALPEPDTLALVAHLRTCPACDAELKSLLGVKHRVARLPPIAAPEQGAAILLAAAREEADRAGDRRLFRPPAWFLTVALGGVGAAAVVMLSLRLTELQSPLAPEARPDTIVTQVGPVAAPPSAEAAAPARERTELKAAPAEAPAAEAPARAPAMVPAAPAKRPSPTPHDLAVVTRRDKAPAPAAPPAPAQGEKRADAAEGDAFSEAEEGVVGGAPMLTGAEAEAEPPRAIADAARAAERTRRPDQPVLQAAPSGAGAKAAPAKLEERTVGPTLGPERARGSPQAAPGSAVDQGDARREEQFIAECGETRVLVRDDAGRLLRRERWRLATISLWLLVETYGADGRITGAIKLVKRPVLGQASREFDRRALEASGFEPLPGWRVAPTAAEAVAAAPTCDGWPR